MIVVLRSTSEFQPHLYTAGEGDVQRMLDADLICCNGLHLEGKLTEVLEQAKKRGVAVLAAAEGIDPSRLLTHTEHEYAHDPHVWFDVTLWMEVVKAVRDRLIDLDPGQEGRYRERSRAYLNLLKKLDEEGREELARVPEEKRVLITAHDAFNYFGRAYGFEVQSCAAEAGTADVLAAAKAKGFDDRIGVSLYSDAMGDPERRKGPTWAWCGTMCKPSSTVLSAEMNAIKVRRLTGIVD